MIGYIRGTLISKTLSESTEMLIDVSGVGYRVTLGKGAISNLVPKGGEITVYTSHQVREDSETLYGFIEEEDRNAFELLLKIHKVGPAMAMEILDSYNLEQLQAIVASADINSLTAISGIGKTTAERLLTELKNKLKVEQFKATYEDSGVTGEVIMALQQLGFSGAEIKNALQEIAKNEKADSMGQEEMLKEALGFLGR